MTLTLNAIKTRLVPIARRYGVKRMYLFGSYAKGTAAPGSDVDILVEKGEPLTLIGLSGMRLNIEDALSRPVDLVTTTSSDKAFLREIGGTEVLIYEAE